MVLNGILHNYILLYVQDNMKIGYRQTFKKNEAIFKKCPPRRARASA